MKKKKKWEVAYEFYKQGMSKAEACKRANCHMSNLLRGMERNCSDKIPTEEYRLAMKSKVDERNVEIIKQATDQGVSVKKICEEKGINPNNFYTWAKRKGMTINLAVLRRRKINGC